MRTNRFVGKTFKNVMIYKKEIILLINTTKKSTNSNIYLYTINDEAKQEDIPTLAQFPAKRQKNLVHCFYAIPNKEIPNLDLLINI